MGGDNFYISIGHLEGKRGEVRKIEKGKKALEEASPSASRERKQTIEKFPVSGAAKECLVNNN